MTSKEILLAAADHIEKHGWRKDAQRGENGELCAVNALKEITGGVNAKYDAAWELLHNFLGGKSTISAWNDAQEDAATVIMALREAAK